MSSSESKFRLTFHVSHPYIHADEIENHFNFPIKYIQSVGEERKTKTGKLLAGRYKKTNVSFTLHSVPLEFDKFSLEQFINDQMDLCDLKYTKYVHESSGSCHFLIGLFSSENIMFEFDMDTVNRLSIACVSLKLDFYGGDEKK